MTLRLVFAFPKLVRLAFSVCVLLGALASSGAADEEESGFLGIHEADLRITNDAGSFDLLLSGLLDSEYYVVQEEGPGLLFSDSSFANQRLTLFVDTTVGEHWFFFVQARADRGFDPDDHPVEVRVDEVFARYTLSGEDWSAAAQVGKFATPLGNFVRRHDALKNPLVRAPLPYDLMTTVGDDKAPKNNQAQLNRRALEDKKNVWVPLLWGPVYHTGVQLGGTLGRWNLAFAATNSSPSARPDEWAWTEGDQDQVAFSSRLGCDPLPGLRLGLNYAVGPYLRERAEPTLPAGRHRNDYLQRLAGVDVEYAIGHLELWAEVFGNDWQVANVHGRLQALAWYLEAKYTLTPKLHVAARWGQIFFNEILDAAGERTPWDRDAQRAEVGAGYLFQPNLLAKVQYEFNLRDGPRDPDDDLASLSLSLSF